MWGEERTRCHIKISPPLPFWVLMRLWYTGSIAFHLDHRKSCVKLERVVHLLPTIGLNERKTPTEATESNTPSIYS